MDTMICCTYRLRSSCYLPHFSTKSFGPKKTKNKNYTLSLLRHFQIPFFLPKLATEVVQASFLLKEFFKEEHQCEISILFVIVRLHDLMMMTKVSKFRKCKLATTTALVAIRSLPIATRSGTDMRSNKLLKECCPRG